MKAALLCFSLLALALPACTTLQNRRDMYCGYGHVCGPYTCGKYKKKQTVVIETTTTSSGKAVVR